MNDPAKGYQCHDGHHRFGEAVEVVPRAVAEALAEALARVEDYFIGGWPDVEDLKQVWMLVAKARDEFRAIYPKAEEESRDLGDDLADLNAAAEET